MSSEIIDLYSKKLNEIKNLPTLPVIATEIMRITRNDNFSARQIQTVIEKDPPLAMQVLKVANSAYYAQRNPVKSLRHAVVLIGMRQLSNIAISFSVLKRFETQSNNLKWEKFWEHSIAVGFVSELLVDEYEIETRESPYTMGLLHDIGKLVLNILEPEKYFHVYQTVISSYRSFYDVEMEILNITHCEIGKMLAENWKMSEKLIDVVLNHHTYELSLNENKLLNAVIELADHICNIYGISFGMKFDNNSPSIPGSWEFLQSSVKELKNKRFEDFVSEMDTQIASISEMVKLIQV
ncbi:MAG: HDOD domain-containing protein [Candidatus Marinimicrobia bacterium]|nr:HDOD domain-containing protein [Candidatus Neomarinimicrobiota bacterium]